MIVTKVLLLTCLIGTPLSDCTPKHAKEVLPLVGSIMGCTAGGRDAIMQAAKDPRNAVKQTVYFKIVCIQARQEK